MFKTRLRNPGGRRLRPIGVGLGLSTLQTLLSDHFTGTNGTDLTAHTMDVGSGWTAHTGSFQVQSNKASATAAIASYTADAGQADVTVSGTVNMLVSGQNSGLIVRATNDANHWRFSWGGGTLNLQEINANAATSRASGDGSDLTDNTDYAVKIVCSGQNISCYVNNVLRLSYASATFNQTATRHGIRRGTSTVTVDDFLVTKP